MHEIALAQNIIVIVCRNAEASNLQRVTAIGVAAGELIGIVPDALEFGFKVSAIGTLAEDARLEIRHIPALIHCESCNHKYFWHNSGYHCPSCSYNGGKLIEGNEFFVEYIDGHDGEEETS